MWKLSWYMAAPDVGQIGESSRGCGKKCVGLNFPLNWPEIIQRSRGACQARWVNCIWAEIEHKISNPIRDAFLDGNNRAQILQMPLALHNLKHKLRSSDLIAR